MRDSYCCFKHTLPLNLCKLNLTCQAFKINLDSLTIPCGLHKLKSLWAKLLKNASGSVFSPGTRKKRCVDTNAFVSKSARPFPLCVRAVRSQGALPEPWSFPWQGLSLPHIVTTLPKHKSPTKLRKDNDIKSTCPLPSAGCLTASVWRNSSWIAFVFSVAVDTSLPLKV